METQTNESSLGEKNKQTASLKEIISIKNLNLPLPKTYLTPTRYSSLKSLTLKYLSTSSCSPEFFTSKSMSMSFPPLPPAETSTVNPEIAFNSGLHFNLSISKTSEATEDDFSRETHRKLSKFRNHKYVKFIKIVDNVFLSNYEMTKITNNYLKYKIRYILNLSNSDQTEEEKQKNIECQRIYKWVAIDDSIEQRDILWYILTSLDFIKNCLERNKVEDSEIESNEKNMLIYCNEGISRSTTIVISYLLYQNEDMTFRKAFDFVKSKNKLTSPNISFIANIINFKKRLSLSVSDTLSTTSTDQKQDLEDSEMSSEFAKELFLVRSYRNQLILSKIDILENDRDKDRWYELLDSRGSYLISLDIKSLKILHNILSVKFKKDISGVFFIYQGCEVYEDNERLKKEKEVLLEFILKFKNIIKYYTNYELLSVDKEGFIEDIENKKINLFALLGWTDIDIKNLPQMDEFFKNISLQTKVNHQKSLDTEVENEVEDVEASNVQNCQESSVEEVKDKIIEVETEAEKLEETKDVVILSETETETEVEEGEEDGEVEIRFYQRFTEVSNNFEYLVQYDVQDLIPQSVCILQVFKANQKKVKFFIWIGQKYQQIEPEEKTIKRCQETIKSLHQTFVDEKQTKLQLEKVEIEFEGSETDEFINYFKLGF